MKEEVETLILGGGVAGLAAARRLLELGHQPLLIEAGEYPAHKVCGEFFSPTSLPLLKRWEFAPALIAQIHLHTQRQSFAFQFPSSAGALSHYTFDAQLAQQIIQSGGNVLTHTRVEKVVPSTERHEVILSSGERIFAKRLLIATGRFSSQSSPPSFRYVGLKAHFSGVNLNSELEMFAFPGAYLGLAPIEEGKVNLACLATLELYKKFSSPEPFMQHLIGSQVKLKERLTRSRNLFDHWMEVFIPPFGLRSPPPWPNTYWIGDAAATIPPASGNGLTLALTSGCMAAEYSLRNDPEGFREAWKRRCRSPIFFAKGLHELFLRPHIGDWGIRTAKFFPGLAGKVYGLISA